MILPDSLIMNCEHILCFEFVFTNLMQWWIFMFGVVMTLTMFTYCKQRDWQAAAWHVVSVGCQFIAGGSASATGTIIYSRSSIITTFYSSTTACSTCITVSSNATVFGYKSSCGKSCGTDTASGGSSRRCGHSIWCCRRHGVFCHRIVWLSSRLDFSWFLEHGHTVSLGEQNPDTQPNEKTSYCRRPEYSEKFLWERKISHIS